MRRRFAVVVTVAVAAFAFACKKDKPASEAETTASEDEGPTPRKRPEPTVKKVVTAITVDDVTPILVEFPGARRVKEPAKSQFGERVEVGYCFDQGEVATIGETVKTALTDGGWVRPEIRANPKIADRLNLGARREPFMMTGSIQRGAFADCAGDKGQTLVTINVHKQVPRPVGGTAPMHVGPRGTSVTRPIGGPRPLTGEPQIMTPPVAPGVTPPSPAPPPSSP